MIERKSLITKIPNRVTYTNYKGETSERFITPINFWYGKSEFHEDEQWFVTALDNHKRQIRDFALKDMIPNW